MDIVGIGNPLLDIVVEVGDDVLKQFSFTKGNMHLIDGAYYKKLRELLKTYPTKETDAGGSAANVIAGAAALGARTALFGSVGKDVEADKYNTILEQTGVTSCLSTSNIHTGSSIILVTPDKERTMVTFLGAASTLSEIDKDIIKDSKILHIEGYQLDTDNQKKLMYDAIAFAKQHNVLVSIDFADGWVVEKHFEDLQKLSSSIDIAFLNEAEARAFTGVDEYEAIQKMTFPISIVKLGDKGSLVKSGNKIHKIPIVSVELVNTVGAGDGYAAGFLYGLTKEYPLEKCGNIAAYVAAQVVSTIGPRANDLKL